MKFNNYWFKPKKYGYGATPTSWEGWAVVFLFILLIFWRSKVLTEIDPGRFVFELFIGVLILIWVSKAKTSEEWKWRWG